MNASKSSSRKASQNLERPPVLVSFHHWRKIHQCIFDDFPTFRDYVGEFNKLVNEFNELEGGFKIGDLQKQQIFLLNLGTSFHRWVDKTGDVVKLAGYGNGRDIGFDEVVSLAEIQWLMMQPESETESVDSQSYTDGGLNRNNKRPREESPTRPSSQPPSQKKCSETPSETSMPRNSFSPPRYILSGSSFQDTCRGRRPLRGMPAGTCDLPNHRDHSHEMCRAQWNEWQGTEKPPEFRTATPELRINKTPRAFLGVTGLPSP